MTNEHLRPIAGVSRSQTHAEKNNRKSSLLFHAASFCQAPIQMSFNLLRSCASFARAVLFNYFHCSKMCNCVWPAPQFTFLPNSRIFSRKCSRLNRTTRSRFPIYTPTCTSILQSPCTRRWWCKINKVLWAVAFYFAVECFEAWNNT